MNQRSVAAAQEAVAAVRAAGSTFHLAHALLDLASLLDDSVAAQAYVEEAESIQVQLGAATLRARLLPLAQRRDVAPAQG